MNTSELISLLTSLAAVMVSAFSLRKVFWENKEKEASVAAQYQKMASECVEELSKRCVESEKIQSELDKLKEKVSGLVENINELSRIIEEYEKGIDLLIRQLELSGLVPAWKPRKRDK